MTYDIKMPVLSADMEEGTIVAWHKAVGDPVVTGEELVEVETGKSVVVYESPATGSLIEITVEPQTTVPVGTVIARIAESP